MMESVIRIIVFILATLFLIRFSWRSLQNPGTHGFYRFFVFEGILLLLLINQPHWFDNPFSLFPFLSWCFLSVSVCFIVQSLWMLTQKGGHAERQDKIGRAHV